MGPLHAGSVSPGAFSLKQIAKDRILDMLGQVKDGEWNVLILDSVTLRVVSSAVRMCDVLDYNIALTEDLNKRREPNRGAAGVYFIAPSADSIARLVFDFGAQPMYRSAHVFFSTKPSAAILEEMRSIPGLMAHLKTLKQVDLEFLCIDRRTFITNQEAALQLLFGDGTMSSQGEAEYKAEINTAAARLVTVLASLKEFPSIRFRAAKTPDETFVLDARSLVAQRLAVELNDRLRPMQAAGQLPSSETCDVLVVDRGVDVVAPVIHEWTYEAMTYDLLHLDGNVFRYEVETQAGKKETKEHLLGETDEFWSELRHAHLAGASLAISRKLDEFRARNKAAAAGGAAPGELDARGMKALVASLPQYREQLSKLSVHVEIASRLNKLVDEGKLLELGKLEQDMVYGEATSKEVIAFLASPAAQALKNEDKVRLLMSYVATHPDKMDAAKAVQWQKLARLGQGDMNTVTNLELLGIPVRKKAKSSGLAFGFKRKRAVRKDREAGEDEQQFALSRFVPMVQELVEDLVVGKLSAEDYPFVAKLQPAKEGAAEAPRAPLSVRSTKPMAATAGWARKAAGVAVNGDAGGGGPPPASPSAPKVRRVIVFVVGGLTRSEMRVAHRLSGKVNREVMVGSTSVDTPAAHLKAVHELSSLEHIALEIDSRGARYQT